MESLDYKTIIYIALGILYYIYKFSRKKNKAVQPRKVQHNKPEAAKPTSIEVLEKEVENELINISKQTLKPEKKSYIQKANERKSLLKEIKDEKLLSELEYEYENSNHFLEMFKDKEEVKKAFIASEVFNRKY